MKLDHTRGNGMPRRMIGIGLVVAASCVALAGCSKNEQQSPALQPVTASNTQEPGRDGAALFRQYCSSCHPDGGNVSDPKRTLHGSVLRSNGITTPEDVIKIMRNPLSRMIRFDPSTLSDKDARAIAEYILVTFK